MTYIFDSKTSKTNCDINLHLTSANYCAEMNFIRNISPTYHFLKMLIWNEILLHTIGM